MNYLWYWVIWLSVLGAYLIMSTQSGNEMSITEAAVFHILFLVLLAPTALLLLYDPVLTKLPIWLRVSFFLAMACTVPLVIMTSAAQVQIPTDTLGDHPILQWIPFICVMLASIGWLAFNIHANRRIEI